MKKLISLLASVVLSITAFAGTHHIYVDNQSGWENVALYAWADGKSDVDLLGGWPGMSPAAETVEIDGVDYLDFEIDDAAFAANFIFNNNNNGSETGSLWLSSARDYYLTATASELTQKSETYHIYAKNNTGWNPFKLYIWGDRELFSSWSGKEAESEQGDYKVFDMTLFKGETTPTFNLIFNNGAGSQVEGFQVTEARDYYLDVTTTSIVEEGELMYSIYINNQTAWATPALYAYDANNVPQMGTWPGTVSNETETVDEVEYIKFSIPESAFPCQLIFNNGINGEGSAQLADYALTTAGNYYLVAEESGLRPAGEPAPELLTYHLYVRNLTSWTDFNVYAWGTPNEAFGSWPGKTLSDATSQLIDGVTYNVYEYQIYSNVTPEIHLIFHQDDAEENRQLLDITEARDYYITVSGFAAWEGLAGVKRFRPYIPMEQVFGYQYDVNGTVGDEWPGAQLYPDAEGWYEFIVNKGRTVIFNNGTGEGAMQTGDFAYTEADPVADECAVWQGETSTWEEKTYMTTSDDCDAAIALKHERNVTNGNYGTICLPYSAIKVEGAELFSIAGKDENGIYLDEASELLMGVPYIFLANADQLTVYYWGGQSFTPSANHLYTTNGLVGFINDGQEYTVAANANNYILHNNGLYFVDSEVKIVSNRAFIDWSNVPSNITPSSVPRRRIGVYNTPTGVENVQGDKVQCTKVIENGVLYLMYNGQTYDAQGRIVK